MSTHLTYEHSSLFFRTLSANGIFSVTSGFIMLAMSGSLSSFLGLSDHRWLLGLGGILLVFGGALLLRARSRCVTRVEAIAISAMDLGWVVASIVLIVALPGLFTSSGMIAILAVAAVVLAFFELQAFALWKTRAQSPARRC